MCRRDGEIIQVDKGKLINCYQENQNSVYKLISLFPFIYLTRTLTHCVTKSQGVVTEVCIVPQHDYEC